MALTAEIVTCISCVVVMLVCAGPMALIIMWLLQDGVATIIVGVLCISVILITFLIFSSLTTRPRDTAHHRGNTILQDIMPSPPACTIRQVRNTSKCHFI